MIKIKSNERNFGIKFTVRGLYAAKQSNKTKPNQTKFISRMMTRLASLLSALVKRSWVPLKFAIDFIFVIFLWLGQCSLLALQLVKCQDQSKRG